MARIETTADGKVYLSDDWYIEDVHEAARDLNTTLTEEEAETILEQTANRFDANIGVNWEVFYYHINAMKGIENA